MCAPRSASLTSSVSVTSSTSRSGAIPVRSSTSVIVWIRSGCSSSIADRLTCTAGVRVARDDARARLLEHVAPERDDQAGVLGERDELDRGDAAAARVVPAHERLDRDRLAGREVHDRLVLDDQLALLDRAPSSSLRSWRRTIESRIAGVKTAKRRLPPSLASYMATSASRSSSSACVRACCLAAMPIES